MSRHARREAEEMLAAGDLVALGRAADEARRKRFPGDIVTFVIDRNINYTNVCVSGCRFCAFYRPAGHPEAYTLSHEAILEKVREAVAAGATQVMLQGGLHPGLMLEYYTELLTKIKQQSDIIVHSFSPAEILFLARQNGLEPAEVLASLRDAGLDSLPGGGAEILVDSVRQRVSPEKITAGDWLAVMRTAHGLGLKTTATMVIGLGESLADRVAHLEAVRCLQEDTGGFRAFIMWSYQPGNTVLGGEKTSAWDYLRTLAVARLYLDNFDHVQGSWVTQGERIGQLTLAFGADDLGSIMLEENVVRAAGTAYEMSVDKMTAMIRGAGKIPAQRDTAYKILKVYGEK
ncbi:cyclic dehypoxanthinyl futalosine synthase [Anaeroselena agilis]|uniref:Cyclic dehypoxanthine futalosine synthase n=1 Tax=Anaeroselena agilis TaxID=3063788 RepID=A0ABU3NTL4_9FIRM|nr:cyclic dehypoxanthinyl futalosine synthase [Selenomonadales bacterium 4137-cl]